MIKLIHGDCLEEMPKLESGSIDLILADVPYGTTACKWDTVIPFAPMWEQLKRLAKGAIVMTASQPFTSALVMSNPEWFKCEWIWEKTKATGHANVKYHPMKAHENILVFGKSVLYYPQKEEGDPYKQPRKNPKYDKKINPAFRTGVNVKDNTEGGRFPRTIIPVKNAYYTDGAQVHPTQKPVALMEYLIRTYTNEGDVVLDFCFGSGTTGVACIRTNRNFIGIEKDPDYFKIAENRIKSAQPALAGL